VSLLVRDGKGGPRREIGMDMGMGAAAALAHGARRIAGRANVLCDRRTDTRQAVVECCGTERASSPCCSRRDPAPVRAAPATPCARGRARARGSATEHHPAPARPRQLGTTSIYLQGIDTEEIIAAVNSRRAPMMPASAGLQF
jgi:hypothetical protein